MFSSLIDPLKTENPRLSLGDQISDHRQIVAVRSSSKILLLADRSEPLITKKERRKKTNYHPKKHKTKKQTVITAAQ